MDQNNKTLKGYKFRIYPNKVQQSFFQKQFGANRYVWNYMLETKKDAYLHAGIKLNYCDTSKGLTAIKKMEELKWLKEMNSQSIQQELKHLDVAYSRFFRQQADFPQFKSKHDKQSFVIPQHFTYEGNLLSIPKIKEKIKVNQHREFGEEAKILFITISKNKAGKYFASFQVEEKTIKPIQDSTNSIGIDLGLKDLLVFSDGKRIANPKFAKKLENKLDYQHRQLSKSKKDSKTREKCRLKLAKTYEKITNQKLDFTHKLTKKIVDENQIIVMENLDVKSMMQERKMAKSIQQVSWGEIARQLEYKSNWQGKTFVKINRFFPSSKTCGHCGFIKQDLTLQDRNWQCIKCDTNHDRDLNAANNILKQGQNIINNLPDGKPFGKNSDLGAKSESKQKLGEPLKKVLPQGKRNIKVKNLEAASL